MSATVTPGGDDALKLALRCLTHYRAALRHDRRARRTETTLARWARAHKLSLVRATRTRHPLAQELHQHLRAAARARRQRDRLLPALAATPATTPTGFRAKLRVALIFVDPGTPAATLLDSLAHDLRTG